MKSLRTLTLILFCLTNLFAKDSRKKNPMKWSDHQDSMNWHIAKVKCASSQRHIPTRAEMDQNRNKPYKFDLDIHVEQVSEMEPLYSTINQCIFS